MWLNGLDLTIDYNVNEFNVINEPRHPLKKIYYFRIDSNLLAILPDHNSRWYWVAQTLYLIKLPSPMIEFPDDGKIHHLLYPLK